MAPKSGEQDDQIAPRLAVASMAMTASGRLGRKPATRSPGPTPCAAAPPPTAPTSRAQLAIGQRPLPAALVPEDQRRPVVGVPEQVLREVEPRPGEPAGARAGSGGAMRSRPTTTSSHGRPPGPLLADHAAERPHLGPERLGALDRPAIERGKVGDRLGARWAAGRGPAEGMRSGSRGEPARRPESRSARSRPSARRLSARLPAVSTCRRVELRVLGVQPRLVVVRVLDRQRRLGHLERAEACPSSPPAPRCTWRRCSPRRGPGCGPCGMPSGWWVMLPNSIPFRLMNSLEA